MYSFRQDPLHCWRHADLDTITWLALYRDCAESLTRIAKGRLCIEQQQDDVQTYQFPLIGTYQYRPRTVHRATMQRRSGVLLATHWYVSDAEQDRVVYATYAAGGFPVVMRDGRPLCSSLCRSTYLGKMRGIVLRHLAWGITSGKGRYSSITCASQHEALKTTDDDKRDICARGARSGGGKCRATVSRHVSTPPGIASELQPDRSKSCQLERSLRQISNEAFLRS